LLRFFNILLWPVLFIIGFALFVEDKWSILSSLSLLCLIVMALSTYGYFLVITRSSPPPDFDRDAELAARLMRIYIAEFAIFLLMITRVILFYRNHLQGILTERFRIWRQNRRSPAQEPDQATVDQSQNPVPQMHSDLMMRFNCPCGRLIKMPVKFVGKTGQCSKCGQKWIVPRPKVVLDG
jgi:hypothetical protein